MNPYWTNGVATLYQADARAIPLPDKSIHMVVTSPPYWGMRDYGLGVNIPAGIGLEPTLGEWMANIVAVMREVRRVLRDDGTVWVNLGDAYAGSGKGMLKDGSLFLPVTTDSLPAKSLMGQPWRVAFALQDAGWLLRSAIVWHKPNPMPESATDRPSNAYEMVFLLSKQGKYFYDADAIRYPSKDPLDNRASRGSKMQKRMPNGSVNGIRPGNKAYPMANARNVWTIPTQGRPYAHFATFPDELPRRCILAGTSEKGVCGECGSPWVRIVERSKRYDHTTTASGKSKEDPYAGQTGDGAGTHDVRQGVFSDTQTLGWEPTCSCNADVVPATVLDPFVGSGTTLTVAQSLNRRSVGSDLNPEYLEIARRRIQGISLPIL